MLCKSDDQFDELASVKTVFGNVIFRRLLVIAKRKNLVYCGYVSSLIVNFCYFKSQLSVLEHQIWHAVLTMPHENAKKVFYICIVFEKGAS